MRKGFTAAVIAVFLGIIFLFGQGPVQKVRLWDTNNSHSLLLKWNENRAAAYTMNWIGITADRAITLQGNPTLDDWFDQDYHIIATPTFAGLYLESSTGAPFLKMTNESDTERDPIIQFAVGATPVTKFTMGVDDSDEDSFKLSAGSALGTTGLMKITATGWVGINESANVNMTAGLTINQGAADDEILAFKSSDIWNGFDVAWVEDDTYAQFLKISGATGGLRVRGFSEDATGLQLEGFGWTEIVDTTKTTASTGIINLMAHEVRYDSSGEMDLSEDVNVVAIRRGLIPTTVWIIDKEGDSWQSGTLTGTQLISTIATGTEPVDVISTTVCANLNSDLWDSYHLPALAVGDILYGDGTTTLAKLADVAVGSYFRSGGVTTAPLWSTLILPNAATAYRLPVATSANTIGELAAAGADGEYLKGNTGAIPSFATLNQAAVSGLTTADGPTLDHVHLTSGQVGFPATQVPSADVNTLDDYEEGTWVMALTFGGGNAGITYSKQTGYYTKIGNLVTLSGYMALSSKGWATGVALIEGLPFAAVNSVAAYTAVALRVNKISFANQYEGYVVINSTTIKLEEITEAGAVTSLTDADFANDSDLMVNVTYRTS